MIARATATCGPTRVLRVGRLLDSSSRGERAARARRRAWPRAAPCGARRAAGDPPRRPRRCGSSCAGRRRDRSSRPHPAARGPRCPTRRDAGAGARRRDDRRRDRDGHAGLLDDAEHVVHGAADLAHRRRREAHPCGEGGIARLQAAGGVAADLRPLQALALLVLLRRERLLDDLGAADAVDGGDEARTGHLRRRRGALALLRRCPPGRLGLSACSAGACSAGGASSAAAASSAGAGCGASACSPSGVASAAGVASSAARRRLRGDLLGGLRLLGHGLLGDLRGLLDLPGLLGRLAVARVRGGGLALGTAKLAQAGEEDSAVTLGGGAATATARLLLAASLLASAASTTASASGAGATRRRRLLGRRRAAPRR